MHVSCLLFPTSACSPTMSNFPPFLLTRECRTEQGCTGTCLVEGVVVGNLLANIHNMIAVSPDVRRVVKIKAAIELRINGENHLARRERFFKKRPGRSRLEDVISNAQQ